MENYDEYCRRQKNELLNKMFNTWKQKQRPLYLMFERANFCAKPPFLITNEKECEEFVQIIIESLKPYIKSSIIWKRID